MIDQQVVIAKTPVSATFLTPLTVYSLSMSFSSRLSLFLSTEYIEMPVTIRKLKAAEPTIVAGPSSPGFSPSVFTVSITFSSISGALEPNAMSVKLATVGFQTGTLVRTNSLEYGSYLRITRLLDVITSIELQKMIKLQKMTLYLLHENVSDNIHA